MQKPQLRFLNKQEKNKKNMVADELPIGQPLTAVSIIESKQFRGNEICLDQVKLFFQGITITLLPLTDTDEIEIFQENTTNHSVDTPFWCQSFVGKKLMTVWVCDNSQGYQDQVIFAFEYLHPSITFVAEGSVLKVFRDEQVYRVKASEALLHTRQAS
jgi:Family of unknown function (DUF6334)